MEKIIGEHIISHMKENKLFSNKPYGFIFGRSTTLQLLEVIDKWTESIDNGHEVDCIYTDFMKAFDQVPHRRLVKKIEKFGIVNLILDWITDFLSYRKQRVSVNGDTSEWKDVCVGIFSLQSTYDRSHCCLHKVDIRPGIITAICFRYDTADYVRYEKEPLIAVYIKYA
ncbi:unnamed protein product [Mytilus coruscus]|uniref:Uncharacterized protein n=1 Tax=Mytilus coruscus TaxID=42192 RepID=A0A6J8A496_MYTCO|nr:unnamed protein product [Mytilus coruscus]